MIMNASPSSSSGLIKDLRNGNSFCQLCSMQFKSKTITAHINGRKHREAFMKLKSPEKVKKEIGASINEANGIKRKQDQSISSQEFEKRMKNVDDDNLDGNELVEEKHQIKTPWQREVRKQEQEDERNSLGANIIEGLPRGFFDDERMNSRVRETVEKQKQISSEIDRFYKEVEELETQKDDEQEELIEFSAIRSDIEKIDEQIERWKTVNELEKKKEDIVGSVTTKFDQTPNFDPVETDEDADELDFNTINWRTKTL